MLTVVLKIFPILFIFFLVLLTLVLFLLTLFPLYLPGFLFHYYCSNSNRTCSHCSHPCFSPSLPPFSPLLPSLSQFYHTCCSTYTLLPSRLRLFLFHSPYLAFYCCSLIQVTLRHDIHHHSCSSFLLTFYFSSQKY
jgi:hypothetical protein